MKKMLYVGEDIGNANTAMCIHALNVSKLFWSIGIETKILCTYAQHKVSENCEISYLYSSPIRGKFGTRIEELVGLCLWNSFLEIVKKERPDIVLFYGYSIESKIIKFCHKNKIKILVERVDWFEKEDRQGLYGKHIYQRKVDYSINKIDTQSDGLIVISKFLYDFYNKKKAKVFLLPPIFDRIDDSINLVKSNLINIVYAGSLNGSKDVIGPFLECIDKYNRNNGIRYLFHIIGDTPYDIEQRYKKSNTGIIFYGKVNHDDVIKIMRQCHFGILLRNDKRYAKAGFSTKFAEMMSHGLGMICTKVGGADYLIEDKKNGFLLSNNSEDQIMSVLEEIDKLSAEEIKTIRENALETAKNIFLMDAYKEELKEFLGIT